MNAAIICAAIAPNTGRLMNNQKAIDERRQYKRYRFLGGGIALIPLQSATVLGSIRDISIGGVGVTYIDDDAKLNEFSELKADMMEENFYCKEIHCKNIWDKAVVNDHPVITAKMRQSGLQFINLSPDQLSQLKGFIKNTLTQDGVPNEADFFYESIAN